MLAVTAKPPDVWLNVDLLVQPPPLATLVLPLPQQFADVDVEDADADVATTEPLPPPALVKETVFAPPV